MAVAVKYTLEGAIEEFFGQASTTQASCNAQAVALIATSPEDIVPCPILGGSSYTIYAGTAQETVVQFRLKSHKFGPDIMALARQTYGPLAPDISFRGELQDEQLVDKESVYVYVMNRIPGITYIEFILSHT
jgi:hypothetical protein